ncbi:LysR family transcriptional regulator [Shinella sp. S4-D37]|uniref:LysR family transcriptional regulator n=1 Tax=Shinella sp. S4-D37 TaxID=3161999 RepID=UPI00346761FD
MSEVDWSDLQLFFHVAAEGGLAGAAAITGVSAPTIGRRMLALERAMGRNLFIRSQQGYRLAPDGMVLFEHVQTIRRTTADITRWHGDAFALPIVSITGDIWLMGFVAENSRALRGPTDSFRLCCKHFPAGEDLTYRHGMIGLFHGAPKTGNVAVRRSVTVAYAVYRAADLAFEADLPWVSIGTEVAVSDAEKWVFRNHEPQIHTWTNAPAVLARLIASGAGRGVLPAFVGDAMPTLVREGEPIEALAHPLWLAVNDDDRHRPEMRLALDRLASLFKHHEDRFAGRLARGKEPFVRPAARS